MYLECIQNLKKGDLKLLKDNLWLKYLWLNDESRNVNIESYKRIKDIKSTAILDYVERTLRILEEENLDEFEKMIIEEVLAWSEVSKCGNSYIRTLWKEQGFDLNIHNIGSSEIFVKYNRDEYRFNYVEEVIISTLINTHGYIGQFIRGETLITENIRIRELLNLLNKDKLKKLLVVLNKCVIKAVSEDLYNNIKDEVNNVIDIILSNDYKELNYTDRIKRLRKIAILNGEVIKDLDVDLSKVFSKNLWYIEPATVDLSFDEFIKLLFIAGEVADESNIEHISFEKIMNELYYDLKDSKKINIYKKRIIEKLLNNIDIRNFDKKSLKDENVSIEFEIENTMLFLRFRFSEIANKLIDFCIASEGSGAIYERAIVMLYDLFNLRRDAYDRFNNELEYLETMNGSIDYKAKLIDYTVGNSIVDIGPGGGALLDLLEEKLPSKNIYGVDISTNVINSLNTKKAKENKKWAVLEGNALELEKTFEKGSVDTIILSSIVHELFSYIPFEGKRYNYDTLRVGFKSMFNVIPKGGRIVIRDGVMTEPTNQKRLIKFKDDLGLKFLTQYAKDFKGRKISYKIIDKNLVEMPVNDAMEFLYTYTWGEESYSHEVEEQFGYFTPNGYINFLKEVLDDEFKIIKFEHYLQEGYSEHLLEKIEFYDDNFNKVSLPDSTIVIVIEKIK